MEQFNSFNHGSDAVLRTLHSSKNFDSVRLNIKDAKKSFQLLYSVPKKWMLWLPSE